MTCGENTPIEKIAEFPVKVTVTGCPDNGVKFPIANDADCPIAVLILLCAISPPANVPD